MAFEQREISPRLIGFLQRESVLSDMRTLWQMMVAQSLPPPHIQEDEPRASDERGSHTSHDAIL
jgi:hypothetical protein